ncbi:MAG: TIM barrel protein [Nanoarchaeota archaeon]|nr:TIM barrel protein [Nanoarchaeota archaeon]
MADYTNNFYESGYASFDPKENIPHYLGSKLAEASSMGMALDPRSANQLAELSRNLNTGVIPVEIGSIDMTTFDTIPKEHFKEMRRKAKLTGAKVSLHAPIQAMDPSGFGERGWEEGQQEVVERQLKSVMDKAAIIDSSGNMPVTIHGSNSAGSTFKMVNGKKVYDQLMAVDRTTGQLIPIKEDIKYYPTGEIKEKFLSPKKQLDIQNKSKWSDDLSQIEFSRENAEKIMNETHSTSRALFAEMNSAPYTGKKFDKALNSEQEKEIRRLHSAAEYIQDAEMKVQNLFSKAYEFAKKDNNQTQIDHLNEISKRYASNLGMKEGVPSLNSFNPDTQSKALFELLHGLKPVYPKLFQPVEEFSIAKASETFSNVALHSFKKHGEGAPVVSIENLYQGMGFSQSKDLNNLVEESQKKFINKAVKDGYSQNEAEKMAKKLIGVTFDVGHLNVSKAKGFSNKDLIKETEEIRKNVKHVHLTDNFGFNDSHLPIGMGNVPVKEMLEALGEEGSKARKINEVGGWFQHFKTNPFSQILEAAGSPIYSSGVGPYWSQTGGFQQGYLGGYGSMLPDMHYQMFGAGFSQLPSDLGGQRAGAQGSRMSGNSME